MIFPGAAYPKSRTRSEVDYLSYEAGGARVLLVHARVAYMGVVGLAPPSPAEILSLGETAAAWRVFSALSPRSIDRTEDVSGMPGVSRPRLIPTGTFQARFEVPAALSRQCPAPASAPPDALFFEAASRPAFAERLVARLLGDTISTFAFGVRFKADARGYWFPTRSEGTDRLAITHKLNVSASRHVYALPPHDDTCFFGPAAGDATALGHGHVYASNELLLAGAKDDDVWASYDRPDGRG